MLRYFDKALSGSDSSALVRNCWTRLSADRLELRIIRVLYSAYLGLPVKAHGCELRSENVQAYIVQRKCFY